MLVFKGVEVIALCRPLKCLALVSHGFREHTVMLEQIWARLFQ